MKPRHCISVPEVLQELQTDVSQGLTAAEAGERLSVHGLNELVQMGGRGPVRILWEQLSGAMVVMLFIAAGVSFALAEVTDGVVILAIVGVNAVLGFIQDYRAEKALAALKKLAVPNVRVRREGSIREISARELVPGDIVLLEVGNYVPADSRLVEAVNLKIQESALTGESESVEKITKPLEAQDLPLGDRSNMAYMGTVVTYGHGQCVVTATGMNTELGQIARSLQIVESEETPLQKRLAQLGRTLALVALGIVVLVFFTGILRGEPVRLMLMTSLSLAVAVVPEGLPAVATVALALGARRLFRRHALIRRLPAVETLGSVTVICSDKTGTLTENRMTVTVLDGAGDRIELAEAIQEGELVSDEDQTPEGQRLLQSVAKNSSLVLLLTGAGLCNDAELEVDAVERRFKGLGDPTEAALVVAAARLGLRKDYLASLLPRVDELPFDSDRKRMSTVHRWGSDRDALGDCDTPETQVGAGKLLRKTLVSLQCDSIVFTKGAVDGLLEVCAHVWDGNSQLPLDARARSSISQANASLAQRGMRVLGVAFRPLRDAEYLGDRPDRLPDNRLYRSGTAEKLEAEMTFVGMLGIIDPPRGEVAEAVARCRSAGIRAVMITGDHPLTAQHVAQQLKLSEDHRVVTGAELDGIGSSDLSQLVKTTSVYARVSPKHKLQLVQALQREGHVVAMTGDGVNDAPALKQAHIGVAMGITGTDVSKEASQMVLLDDNFATIVNAVEEGRVVYDNIRKFVKYTMTSNAGEIWVMVLGPLLGMPLPLLPLQILWVNLVTDGLPGLALAVEKAESNTMRRPPFPPGQHVFGGGMGWDIAWIGLLMGLVSIAYGYWEWASGMATESKWRTIVFTVLTLSQMGNALATRSRRDSFFRLGPWSNPALIGSVLLTFALQMLVIYWNPLQEIFRTTELSLAELATCLAISTLVFWAVEAQKYFLPEKSFDATVK